jgi:predicted Zn-dependent peptidase
LAGAMANRAVGQPLDLRAQITASAEALTLEQINAFIRDFYDPAKFTLITVGPKG